jgi:hypothetical protein
MAHAGFLAIGNTVACPLGTLYPAVSRPGAKISALTPVKSL